MAKLQQNTCFHKVIIRKGKGADIAELTGLLRLLFNIEEDFTFNPKKQKQGLKMLIKDKRSAVFLAEQNSMVIGMATIQIVISTAEGGPAAVMEDVIVHPDHRSKGAGRRLLKAASDWAFRKRISRLQLLADNNNISALQFYLHTGWQKTNLMALRFKND